MVIVLVGISAWQVKDMLDVDGSVVVDAHRLVSLEGETVNLSEPGKRTLVYFFAPWCSICKVSIGNLDYVQSTDLNVVRVALDYRDSSEVERFVEQNDVNGQVLLGTNFIKENFQIQGYPTYYLLDKDNKVVSRSFGYSTALGLKLKNYLNSN